jgi:hypothetical protein
MGAPWAQGQACTRQIENLVTAITASDKALREASASLAEWGPPELRKLNMNTREKSEIRELTAAALEEVTGGQLVCATGAHLKTATVEMRETRTPVAHFGGIPIY